MKTQGKVYVAGAQTLIGSAILRALTNQGLAGRVIEGQDEPDLTRGSEVDSFFARTTPDFVYLAAGDSGGIAHNQHHPADLMLNNLLVECNVIESAYRHGVQKLLYLASSCTYPKHCSQPMQVASLMSGPLEPTNEAYGLAKIAGIKLCEAYAQQYGVKFISAIVANAFGPGDDFSLTSSHVIPALIRKMHQAKKTGEKSVEIWGSGTPRREFIYADDLADACLFTMENYDDPTEAINLGNGTDLSIKELAQMVREVVGYGGELHFERRKPDGMPEKRLDSTRLAEMGWGSKTSMISALAATYQWFLENERDEGASYVGTALSQSVEPLGG